MAIDYRHTPIWCLATMAGLATMLENKREMQGTLTT